MIRQATWQDNHWQVECDDGQIYPFERIWLATGTSNHAHQHRLLKDVLLEYPTTLIEGLPVFDSYLRLPGSELFIMGGLAALQIRPVARNLAGGRMASDRIVPALSKASLAL
ncbi:hypothetical protein [Gloeothece citriformis]|uniref:hypothetical protein n=1 Tax=Gloeothece citriformis TaxID=2546356 RepID=UPI000173D74D|nr:hypothetical protein [Gloeothece citriformis]